MQNGVVKKDKFVGDIKFNNVKFSYPSRPGETILHGLDLTIQAGKVTAICGDSGAGKSTLTNLMLRLYDPEEGSITLDGVDLKEYDLNNLHGKVGVVNQMPNLFNATIYENIA